MTTNATSDFNENNSRTGQSGGTVDNSYATGNNESVPVVGDDVPVDQASDTRDADSDAALRKCSNSHLNS